MASGNDNLNILAADDDASTIGEIRDLVGDAALQYLFADTPNAISRTMEEHDIDIGLVHVHEGTLPLLEATARQLRNERRPIPLLALVDADPDSAAAAARAGVEGCVRVDDPKAIPRLVCEWVRLLREQREQRAALEAVSDIQERYNLLLESSREAIAYLHQGLHIYANPSYLEKFGYEDFEELEGLSVLDLLSSSGDVDLKKLLKSLARGEIPEAPIEVVAVREDGEEFHARAEFSPSRYAGEPCTQIMVREKSEASAELQQELEKLRSHDLLTGLLNRQAFIRSLHEELSDAPEDRSMAVLLLMLSNQDDLHRKVGTSATDLLVKQTAELFGKVVDERMLPTRLSDHVLAARLWVEDRREAEQLASRLVEGFSGQILEIRDKSPTITASVGMAIGGAQMFSADELLGQAESAMQEAERAGGNSYVRYRPRADSADAGDVAQWTEQLRHALNNDEFRLVRLPITSMEDDSFRIHEVETRLRMEGSDEIVLPETWRPAALQAGLAPEVDRNLVEHLVQLVESGNHSDDDWLLPLSGPTLGEDSFIDWFQQILEDERLPARKLIVGFREAEVRDNQRELQRFVTRFGARGARFALLDIPLDGKVDLLLKNVDVDFIKLDSDIGSRLGRDDKVRETVEAQAKAAAERDVRVIAPKVENTSDLATLWQCGITLVQDDFVREEET